jgi:hypothetical protein
VGIRKWDLRKVISWLPEASDNPLQGRAAKHLREFTNVLFEQEEVQILA